MTTTTPIAAPTPVDAARVARWIVAACLIGAGLIHMAYAPEHLSESTSHGVFFVVVAWLQLGLGALIGANRGGPLLLRVAIVVNLAVVAVWLFSRTVGIDGVPEPWGFPDGLASGLAIASIAGCIALATGRLDDVTVSPSTSGALAGASAMAVTMLVTASLVPGLGGGHQHAEGEGHSHGTEETADGHDHSAAEGAAVEAAHEHAHDATTTTTEAPHDHASGGGTEGELAAAVAHDHGGTGTTPSDTTPTGHDHGSPTTTTTTEAPHDHGTGPGTDAGTGTGTGTDGHDHGGGAGTDTGSTGDTWEQERREALIGGASDAKLVAVNAASYDHLATYIRTNSGMLKKLSEKEREQRIELFTSYTIAHAADNEHGGNHSHGPTPWQDLSGTDNVKLQAQLQTAATVIPKYPTAADAMKAGYFMITPWVPGIGSHYLNTAYINSFDPAKPSILLFNGNKPTSVLTGVSYSILSDKKPAGFVGPNDTWHEHPQLCLIGGFVIGNDNTPPDLCTLVGGTKGNGFGGGHFWMMHLWQVPGWESSWGLFSGENPRLNVALTDGGT